MHDPARVRVSGPLGPYAAGYEAELERLGYTASGAVLSLRLLADLSAVARIFGDVFTPPRAAGRRSSAPGARGAWRGRLG